MGLNLLYLAAFILASPWILYRNLRHGRYRRGWREKLIGLSSRHPASRFKHCIWMHGVSVGEINLLRPLVAELKSRCPDQAIVISSSTDAGYDLAIEHHGTDHVFFCPFDFSWAVKRTLRQLNPAQLILAELELWPNLIRSCNRLRIPVRVVNARLSEKSSAGYQRFGWLTRQAFSQLDEVLCQDETTARRFKRCGTLEDRLSVTGSLKFDNAPSTRECAEVQSRSNWAHIDPWHRVWVVGSTQAGEEQMAIECYRELVSSHPELRLVLVPRHPQRFDAVAKIARQNGLDVRRRTNPTDRADSWDSSQVLLIDTIGELRFWWGVGQMAFVGGSFGERGGQNMLEPAGYGSAVCFGPNTKNFSEIAERLLAGEGAVRVNSRDEMKTFVRRCLEDPPAADALGRAARRVVNQHRGAMGRTVDAIARDLNTEPTPLAKAS
ncbi:MAG: 3-deoxy-D-manno-octulosonic acid transferase [Planctomycetota bacterium]